MNARSTVPSQTGDNIGRSVFNPFGSLHREIDRLFEEFTRGGSPAGAPAVTHLVPSIDIVETENNIQISAEMPGLERKDIDISVDGNMLTIRGEKKVEEQQKDKNVQVSERMYGVFLRVLELPSGVDPSQIQATMSNGVLKITMPKPSRNEPKKIEIKEAA
jgi:HSP20 family protein